MEVKHDERITSYMSGVILFYSELSCRLFHCSKSAGLLAVQGGSLAKYERSIPQLAIATPRFGDHHIPESPGREDTHGGSEEDGTRYIWRLVPRHS
jgi:hypothetical protein